MKLVANVLKDVAVDQQLQDQGELSMALLGLAEAYTQRVSNTPDPVEINPTSTGRELMIAISGLRMKDKVVLLQLYKDARKAQERANTQPPPEDVKPGEVSNASSQLQRLEALEAEERIKFRALARKVALFALAPIPPFIAGTWFVISWQKGDLGDSAIASGLMTTVTEIFKVIFTN